MKLMMIMFTACAAVGLAWSPALAVDGRPLDMGELDRKLQGILEKVHKEFEVSHASEIKKILEPPEEIRRMQSRLQAVARGASDGQSYDCVVGKRFMKGPGQLEEWTDETTRTRGVIASRKGGVAKFSNGVIEYIVGVDDMGTTISLQDLTSGQLASAADIGVSRVGRYRHLQINLFNQKGGLLGEKDTRVLQLTCSFD